jgi:acyl transferase domain-containing protein/acyl carrier protein
MDNYEAIAIIGMAGRFPAAPTVDELWDMLRDGRSAVWAPSDDELRAFGVSEERLNHPNYVRARMRFEDADLFDAGFFGYSARHAQMLDPQQRLFLECAWEAFETAGYDAAVFPGLTGVFASCGTNVYLLDRAMLAHRDVGSWRKSDWADMLLDADKDHIATRVSFKLGLTGPSIGVQTTCSSSLVAVHLACESLRRRECDLALAGGVSLISAQHRGGYFYVKDGMNSPDGQCRAFDENAAGTAWGSGVGIVVLKRHEDAVRDGDHICALIEATAINNDGASKMGYNAPSVQGQQEVIATAQALAGVTPDDIDLIEAHGTGTSLGDSIELGALIELFSNGTGERRQPCAIGSIKTNIGHLDIAAGITGLIKAVLCLEHRAFVPSLNFSTPNPALSVPGCPLYVNTEYRPWPLRPGSPCRASVSSLGFGGTNAHAILREATEARTPVEEPTGVHIFPLSARGPAALAKLRKRFAAHLRAHPELDLGDIAFTLQTGRRRFQHRQAIVADNRDRLLAALDKHDADLFPGAASDRSDCSVVLVFGEGPAVAGVGIESLYHSDFVFRSDVETCEQACRVHADVPLTEAVLGRSDAAATNSIVARALRFTLEYAMAKLWLRWGVTPAFVMGHGMGRLTAQCVAGMLTLDDAMCALQEDQPAANPADTVHIYRIDSQQAPQLQPLTWQDVMHNSNCKFLQLSPGKLWADLLVRESAYDPRTALLPAFIEHEPEALQHLLQVLANLWLQGKRIDWQRLHEGKRRMRVPLPTYPFERASYWLPIPEVPREVLTHADAELSVQSSDQRFFVPSWRVTPGNELAGDLPEPGECWLIMAEDALSKQLARQLEEYNAVPILVVPATEFRQLSGHKFAIVPDSAADYTKLFQELRARNLHPRRLVHGWTLMHSAASPTSTETFWQQQKFGYLSLLALSKALAAQTQAGDRSLVIVTRRTFAIGNDETSCNLANATIPGLCKVMAQELPGLRCTLLDLTPNNNDTAGPAAETDSILAEAMENSREPVVAYRGGLRLVQTLHEQSLPKDSPMVRDLRERGVYVITGGLGKIGLALAKRLAKTCKARLVLLTRNPFPERSAWPSIRNESGAQGVAAKIRALIDIEESGSEVAVYSADVRDEKQLERAFADAESRFGPVAGVFHLAADMTHSSVHSPLTALTRQDVEAQMGPKIGGVYALSRVLETRQPDFGVLFSSNSSVLGGFGFGAYAAANSFLDQFVSARLNDHFQWLCTNWDRWSDHAPMADGSDAERFTITTQAGLDALWAIMTRSAAPQVIVAAASLRERRERWVVQRQKPAVTSGMRASSSPAHSGVAPRTELERTIATIWQEVLGCQEIGVEDSFLDMGGDSLIALRILSRLRELFQVEVPLKAMLSPGSTVASLVLQLVTELQRAHPAQPTLAVS